MPSNYNAKKPRVKPRKYGMTALLWLLLLLAFWLTTSMGPAVYDLSIPIKSLLSLFGQAGDDYSLTIVNNIRVPRAIFALLIGATLSISGASLQGICRNPLADPGLLGISAGAAAVAVSSIVFMKYLAVPEAIRPYSVPIAAFIGSALTTFLIHQMAQIDGRLQIVTLLLAGVAFNSLFGAIIGLMSYLADDQSLRLITYWLMGSLSSANWQNVAIVTPILLLSIWGIYRQKTALNLLLLGEANARFIGVNVEQVKKRLLLLNAIAIGVAVSVSGIIGFVGLVVPHILRMLGGSDYRHLLPNSMLLGASTLLLADMVAKNAVSPAEMPIGLVTSLLGAPVFIALLIKQRRKLIIGA